MSQVQPLPASTVLLIEADPSLRRLIMLGLSHSGMRVIETCSIQEIPALDDQTLDLLIVDVDQGVKSDWSLLSTLREQAYPAPLPIVALSWESPTESNVGAVPYACPPASLFSSLPFMSPRSEIGQTAPTLSSSKDITCLSKPFDARALHSTITKLLAERAAQQAALLAQVEAQVLASYEQHAAPSVWPIVTAAGILLMVTGLLFHFLIALIGVVLVLISLLLWTLGTKPTPYVSSLTVSPAPVAN